MASMNRFQKIMEDLKQQAIVVQSVMETEAAASNVFNLATAERQKEVAKFEELEKQYYVFLSDLKDKGFEANDEEIEIPAITSEEALILALGTIKGKLMATVDQVLAEVAETTGVVNSAIAFISGVKSELAAAQEELAKVGINSAKLDEVVAGLDANQNNLAAAIATPQPAPVPDIPATDPPPADPVVPPSE